MTASYVASGEATDTKKNLRILIVEDDEVDAILLENELKRGGFNPTMRRVWSVAEFNAALDDPPWDLVISDSRLPGFSGLEALKLVQARGWDLPFILISGVICEDQAVTAMKAGAHDFIAKDKLARLVPAVERELREANIRRLRRRAEEDLRHAKTEWERTFDTVPDLIAILDSNHQILRANRAMADRLKLTPEKCLGLCCSSAVHGSGPNPNCPHSLTLADGKQHAAEIFEPRLGGHFLVTTTPLRDDRGQVIGTVHVARDITDSKRAETELRENQERLLLAQQAGAVGVFDINYQKRTCIWTNELKALFGLPASYEATPESLADLVLPEDRDAFKTRLRRAFQTRTTQWEISYRLRRPDGQVRWFESRALITYNATGAAVRMVGATTDITSHKAAREQLQANEQQLKKSGIIGVLTLGVAVFFVETLVMLILAKLPKLPAWQEALADSTVLLLLASPILYYCMFRPMAQLLRERNRAHEELRQANEHLELRVQERTASLEQSNQELQVQITKTQSAQAALAESNRQKEEALARLDALFECAPLGMGFWDMDLRSLRVNPALARLNRLPKASPQGWTPDQLLPASEEIPAIMAEWKRILISGEPRLNVEFRGKSLDAPDQTRCWVGNWFPVRVHGKVIGIGATLLDITERRRAQDALRQAHDDLEQQVRDRAAALVTANAALRKEMAERRSLEARLLEVSEREQRRIGQDLHDSLCQQLSGIGYLCNTAQDQLAQVAPAQKPLLDRISELLRDAVDQARGIARGLHPVENEPNGLAMALNDLADSCRHVYRVSVRFESPHPVLVQDNFLATHLFRIVQEALSNAIRHGNATRLIIRLQETPDHIILTVKDNGSGLSNNPRTSKGLGLLTMEYRALTIGAELDIQDSEKQGAILTCRVPKKKSTPIQHAT